MPYIKENHRHTFRNFYNESVSNPPTNPGELNYLITLLIKGYLGYGGLNYQGINDVLGALDGAKAEFYRRVVVPYEDNKIQENGDVYD
jgi:hypothetical protein